MVQEITSRGTIQDFMIIWQAAFYWCSEAVLCSGCLLTPISVWLVCGSPEASFCDGCRDVSQQHVMPASFLMTGGLDRPTRHCALVHGAKALGKPSRIWYKTCTATASSYSACMMSSCSREPELVCRLCDTIKHMIMSLDVVWAGLSLAKFS